MLQSFELYSYALKCICIDLELIRILKHNFFIVLARCRFKDHISILKICKNQEFVSFEYLQVFFRILDVLRNEIEKKCNLLRFVYLYIMNNCRDTHLKKVSCQKINNHYFDLCLLYDAICNTYARFQERLRAFVVLNVVVR